MKRTPEQILATPTLSHPDDNFALWEQLYGVAADESLDVGTRARAVRRMDELADATEESEGLDDMKCVEEFMADARRHGYPPRD